MEISKEFASYAQTIKEQFAVSAHLDASLGQIVLTSKVNTKVLTIGSVYADEIIIDIDGEMTGEFSLSNDGAQIAEIIWSFVSG